MNLDKTFGRRCAGAVAQTPATRTAEPPSPEIEAFCAALKSDRKAAPQDFAGWRRKRLPSRLMVWTAGLALLAPGLACFVFQAPGSVSIGVELAGLAANGWLRRERQRQLREIAEWSPPGSGD